MFQKIYDFYLKKSILIFSSILAVICWLVWGLNAFIADQYSLSCYAVIFFALTAGLLSSYVKGAINVQKMLFGALLIFLIRDFLDMVFIFIEGPISIVSWIGLIASIIMFIGHLLQQTEKHNKLITPIISQFSGIMILVGLAIIVVSIVGGNLTPTDIPFSLAVVFTSIMIICMETRIHTYKLLRAVNRANGTWNEETRAKSKDLFKI